MNVDDREPFRELLDDRRDREPLAGEVVANQRESDWTGEVGSDARLSKRARRRLGLRGRYVRYRRLLP